MNENDELEEGYNWHHQDEKGCRGSDRSVDLAEVICKISCLPSSSTRRTIVEEHATALTEDEEENVPHHFEAPID